MRGLASVPLFLVTTPVRLGKNPLSGRRSDSPLQKFLAARAQECASGTARFALAHARLANLYRARAAELDADPRTWRPDPDEVDR